MTGCATEPSLYTPRCRKCTRAGSARAPNSEEKRVHG